MKISRPPHDGVTAAIKGTLLAILSVFGLLRARLALAQTFTVDMSAASPLTGLWWNANESDWGATITQQSNILLTAKSMSLEFALQLDTTETCTIAAILGGSRP